MNKIIYNKFITNNKQFIEEIQKNCTKSIIRNCDEIQGTCSTLYHGTTPQNAENILTSGFIIDRFQGTQPFGIGVYTAFDKETAEEFGDKILTLEVFPNSILRIGNRLIYDFNGLMEDYTRKIKKVFLKNKDEYYSKDEWIKKVEECTNDTCEFLAKKKGITVEEQAINMTLQKESSIIFANLFDDEVTKKQGKKPILSSTLGIYMDPIQQLVIRNLDDIKNIK